MCESAVYEEGNGLGSVDTRLLRCSEISRELYGHVHLLCQYIPKSTHIVVLTFDDVLIPEDEWDTAL
jgi:hypothetical protein